MRASIEPRRTGYLAASVGWTLGLVVPLLGSFVAILAWASRYEESWGFEYFLLVPVALVSVLLIAPVSCALALRRSGHVGRAGTARWSALLGVLLLAGTLVSLSMTAGVIPLVLIPLVPLVARRQALVGTERRTARATQSAGRPASGP